MKKNLFLLLLSPIFLFAQQPTPNQNLKISPTQIKKEPSAQVTAPADLYDISFTIMIYEGRNTLMASKNKASIVLLLATGLYATGKYDIHYNSYEPGPRKVGVYFTGRIADTSISRAEIFYTALNNQTFEWDLVNLRIQGRATNKRTGQTFMWEVNDLFPGIQVLRPGTVAISPERRPVRPPAWASLKLRNLYPMLLIGNDGIKSGFQSLSFTFNLSSRPGTQFDRIIGGNYLMPQLPLQNTLFFTNEAMINNYMGGAYIMDNNLSNSMVSEINNLGVSYNFGDHGAFENDDFDLKGICVNYYLTPTTGYRFYTNWNINARINRTGRWMMR